MPGELIDDAVIIGDPKEASQVYNKGFYGYPRSGGSLELDLMEAAYLVECQRLEVTESGHEVHLSDLIARASAAHQDFDVQYIVYRDLRQRGYVVKGNGGEFDFRVFPRGGNPTNSSTKYWIMAASERSVFNITSFLKEIDQSTKKRKELLVAIVDEEGDITYYKPSRTTPSGSAPNRPIGEPVEGFLMEDRVLVFDERGAEKLYRDGYYGKRLGKMLQLSLIESAYLLEEGRLLVRFMASKRKISPQGFRKRAMKYQPDFDLRLRAFGDLRSKGLIVKTGFKYGSHFRVYEGDPERFHAKYLVHAVPQDYRTMWPEVSRAVRLAHGVKKEILFGRVLRQSAEYVRLKRIRP